MESPQIGNTILMLPDLAFDNLLIQLDAESTNQFIRSYEEKTHLVMRHVKIVINRFMLVMQQMQEKVNTMDPIAYYEIDWPPYISKLIFFEFRFTVPSKFLLELYAFYIPLATIFVPTVATQLTYTKCIQRMSELSESKLKLTSKRVVEFVDLTFAALTQIKQLNFYPKTPTIDVRNAKFVQLELFRKLSTSTTQITAHRNYLYNKMLIQHIPLTSSNILPHPDELIQLAIYLVEACQKVFEKADSLRIYTNSFFVDLSYIEKFTGLTNLHLHINNSDPMAHFLKGLSAQNRIKMLGFKGSDWSNREQDVNMEMFNPMEKFTSLKNLYIINCPFIKVETMAYLLSKTYGVELMKWDTDTTIDVRHVHEMLRRTMPTMRNQKLRAFDFNGVRLVINSRLIGNRMSY